MGKVAQSIFQPKFRTNQLGPAGSGGTPWERDKILLLIGGKLAKSGLVTEINLWGDILGNIEQNLPKKNHV